MVLPRCVAMVVVGLVVLTGCGGQPGGVEPPAPAAAVADSGLRPVGRTLTGVPVDRVVDGDTIAVRVGGEVVTVRMIGINTPETVKPDSPVECFGPEASEFAKQSLTGATVTLELDSSQGDTDRYGRTLAYVWVELPGGSLDLFNLDAVAGGYAFARQYGPKAFAWKAQFDDAQRQARAAGRGLWSACGHS